MEDEYDVRKMDVDIVRLVLGGRLTNLSRAFTWEDTPEGGEFWSKACWDKMTPEAYIILWTRLQKLERISNG